MPNRTKKPLYEVWVDGLKQKAVTPFNAAPETSALRQIFLAAVRAEFLVAGDRDAELRAKMLGLRLAMHSTEAGAVCYYEIDDLSVSSFSPA